MELNVIHNIDCLKGLKILPDNCIDCCITSPPYWNLRDYGVDGQHGLEKTPGEYVENMVAVFHQVKRVLKPEGTLWLNLGDSYAVGKGSGHKAQGKHENIDGAKANRHNISDLRNMGLKNKDLVGIPWMVAFALRNDGWYLRQDIIWHKPNPMPESVRDRCTKSHEYIFLLSKSDKYYFDQESILEPVAESTTKRMAQDIENQQGSSRVPNKTNGNMKAVTRYGGHKYTEKPEDFYRTKSDNIYDYKPKRNKRSVWTVTTKKFKEAHFATFPPDLILPCILAGCHEGGTIIDPYMGSGTVAKVAKENNRNYIGFELNSDYCGISKNRLKDESE